MLLKDFYLDDPDFHTSSLTVLDNVRVQKKIISRPLNNTRKNLSEAEVQTRGPPKGSGSQ